MNVTIFTDASFDGTTHAAGWAAWIKFGPASNQTLRFQGQIKAPLSCSLDAELAAIVNAIHVATRDIPLSVGDRVILNTDCLGCIDILEGKTKKPLRRPVVPQMLAHIRETIAAAGFSVEFRHVKAHRKGIDPRSAVNEWVDKAARKQMRDQRHGMVKMEQKKVAA